MGVKVKKTLLCFCRSQKKYLISTREVTRWALGKVGVEEWLVSTVMAMYEEAKTVIRTPEGDSSALSVKVGLHEGSVLSPLLFVIVMEVIIKELQVGYIHVHTQTYDIKNLQHLSTTTVNM